MEDSEYLEKLLRDLDSDSDNDFEEVGVPASTLSVQAVIVWDIDAQICVITLVTANVNIARHCLKGHQCETVLRSM